jgi:hypothetical protein
LSAITSSSNRNVALSDVLFLNVQLALVARYPPAAFLSPGSTGQEGSPTDHAESVIEADINRTAAASPRATDGQTMIGSVLPETPPDAR